MLESEIIISDLDHPWEMVWGPDNQLWITERFGRISHIDPMNGTQTVLLDLSDTVAAENESGMLGLALAPGFPADNRVYTVYTYRHQGEMLERLVVFEYEDDELMNEVVLIDGIDGNTTHNGSRLLFGPDKKLYMTTGDAQDQPASQDPNSLNGKVLRINPNGSIPSDNPDPNSYVYSLGHRNAQGLCIGPDDQIFSSEHGPSSDDEVNLIEAGRNYGWPNVNGYCDSQSELAFCDQNNVAEPLIAWTPTIAPSELEYYDSDAIPELKGKFLLATLKQKDLRVLSLDNNGQLTEDAIYFDNEWDRLRAICIAPDGSIYLSNSKGNWGSSSVRFIHEIIRIYNPQYQGFLENQEDLDIDAFPNPFRNDLQIRIGVPSLEHLEFAIVNNKGDQVMKGKKSEVIKYLNSTRASDGIYTISTETETASWQKRIVKAGY